MILAVPELEEKPWATLGPQVCAWIEANLVFGPGDLLGQPARLDEEKRLLLYRAYEVHPEFVHTRKAGRTSKVRNPLAGRRRFKRVAFSLRKGSAKTEFAAWIAAAELSQDGPVRCAISSHTRQAAFDHGQPIGAGVVDPYIPMVAYTAEQSEELAYGALRLILVYSSIADQFDIGLERIMRIGGDGKATALAQSPAGRDGARTTFQHFDETHRFELSRLKKAHRTMLANIPKRRAADAWSLETTTAPAPGAGSVAEETREYADAVHQGRVKDSTLFFFHREASHEHDLATEKGLRAAILEASGPNSEWSDIAGIMDQFKDPTADVAFLRRVWLNQTVKAHDRAFDATRFLVRAKTIAPKAKITLGFDGSRSDDSTGLVATEISTGLQELLGLWERPFGAAGDGWKVDEVEVDQAVAAAMKRYDVFRMYADPPYWETWVSTWAGQYGDKRVIAWYTNRWPKMAAAVRAYANAIVDGHATYSHDDNRRLLRHLGNAYRKPLALRDEKGEPLWAIQKERHDSPNKIDAAMAAILSWEARRDALTLGAGSIKTSVYESRGLLVL